MFSDHRTCNMTLTVFFFRGEVATEIMSCFIWRGTTTQRSRCCAKEMMMSILIDHSLASEKKWKHSEINKITKFLSVLFPFYMFYSHSTIVALTKCNAAPCTLHVLFSFGHMGAVWGSHFPPGSLLWQELTEPFLYNGWQHSLRVSGFPCGSNRSWKVWELTRWETYPPWVSQQQVSLWKLMVWKTS